MRTALFAVAAGLTALAALCTASATQPAVPAQSSEAEGKLDRALALMDRGDEQSLVQARMLLREAMGEGHVEAQSAYAGLLLNGAGGPRDEAEGRRLLLDAAERGSVGANMTLSLAYSSGDSVFPRDPRRAFQHMRAAATSPGPSDGSAEWHLGMMHLQGTGTPRDAQEAYRWVARAAERGSVSGMISCAVMLATGQGIARDPVAARSWYERAARSGRDGWAHALRGLGGMMVLGDGGPVDLPRGFGYLLVAHSAGDELAGRLIEELRARITPEIERQALAVATEWRGA